ncbi:type III pantothenate kinase [Butyrivibrio sp. INlla16]|uniref:type III pantothenate kinase n=1 Tax=Butyrivibrio sp. INlla16 TaxID=1520807 RepID=UPI000890ADE4|nr:type III pantothenate kinase [Butyrivibrio sp. INlla16]SDB66788.1 type III pantothenate kinase [Butyrivibrio sp. INlla16]
MSRILTVDIGNSSIVAGVLNNGEPEFTGRIATMRDYGKKEITKALGGLLQDYLGQISDDYEEFTFKGAILSSVVPEINEVTLYAMEEITGTEPLLMSDKLITGIDISNYSKGKIGADRIVDLSAAKSMFKDRPVMVCDLGTCSTITVADENGKLIGGMIAPGVQLSLDAEAMRTAQLPQLSAGEVTEILGTDTASNMMSGAVAGAGMMISGAAERISADYKLDNMALVITGGLGSLVIPWINREVCYEKDLLLRGLNAIFELNASSYESEVDHAIRKKYSIRSYRGDRGLQVG